MKREKLALLTAKLILVVILIINIGAVFEVSEHISVKSKIIVQPVMAQDKTPDKTNIPKWGREELPENTIVDAQLNIENIVFNYGVIISILVITYGVIKFILAIRKKDEKKRYKAQKIIAYGFVVLIFLVFLFFPKSIVL